MRYSCLAENGIFLQQLVIVADEGFEVCSGPQRPSEAYTHRERERENLFLEAGEARDLVDAANAEAGYGGLLPGGERGLEVDGAGLEHA